MLHNIAHLPNSANYISLEWSFFKQVNNILRKETATATNMHAWSGSYLTFFLLNTLASLFALDKCPKMYICRYAKYSTYD